MVSTIDDFERETRSWLRQCMYEISGYPDVSTVSIKSWNNNSRPTVPSTVPNGNYLLGYNTSTGSLELIGKNNSRVDVLSNDIKKSIALMAHPVGEYYWTSNASFNPATAWGGTWERIQDGRVLISNNGSHAVGSTGGSETVTLSLSQIPSHSHPHTHRHDHGRGSMNITGYFGADDRMTNKLSGAFYNGGWGYETGSQRSETGNIIQFDASRTWGGRTTTDATGASAHAQGGGQAHNNMQPYRTAICWHRTA